MCEVQQAGAQISNTKLDNSYKVFNKNWNTFQNNVYICVNNIP